MLHRGGLHHIMGAPAANVHLSSLSIVLQYAQAGL